MKRKLGIAMMAAPFVGMATVLFADAGLVPVLIVFGGSAALVAWVVVAAHLMDAA